MTHTFQNISRLKNARLLVIHFKRCNYTKYVIFGFDMIIAQRAAQLRVILVTCHCSVCAVTDCSIQHYRCCRVMQFICSNDCIRVNWVK